jgi:hypothetical protein
MVSSCSGEGVFEDRWSLVKHLRAQADMRPTRSFGNSHKCHSFALPYMRALFYDDLFQIYDSEVVDTIKGV